MRLSTRLTIAMVALVTLTATAVGLATYRNIAAVAVPRALDRVDTRAHLLASELAASVSARADLLGFRSEAVIDIIAAHMKRGTDPASAATELEARRRLEVRLIPELVSKPNYHEFRIIGVDDGGRELVRVDRSGPGGAPRAVPESGLQRMSEPDALASTIKLPAGEIYVSPIDLNRDNGVIAEPHVPVLRLATPLHAPDGQPFGMLIITVDMRPAFARVRAVTVDDGRSYVVNERGDYLVHPDQSREFGFESGTSFRIQDDFPEFPRILAAQDTGPRVIQDRAGEYFGVGFETVRLAEARPVTVIQVVPYAALQATAIAARESMLLGGLAAVFFAVLLAVIVARSLTRPLVQMTKAVEGFSRDGTIALPSGGGQETRVLADAFAHMASEVRAKTDALNQEVEQRRRTFERQQLFIAAVESSNDAIITTTPEGLITGWNPAAERLFGSGAAEAVGESIDIIVPADLRAEARATLDKIRGGEKVDYHETVRTDRTGQRIDVSLGISPIRSEAGQIIGAAMVARDITASRKAQEALLESEQMARDIISNALEAFVQTDDAGRILEWNPQAEALFGWPRGEATGQSLASLLLSDDYRSHYRDMHARLMRDGDGATSGERFELEAVAKDGHKVKIEVSLKALRQREGHVFNAFLRDLTQRTAAEEQLRQAQKMEAVGQLTGGVAHDFNNVLTVITGTIDILAEAVADRPSLRAVAELIGQAAERGAELTQHLLAFARKQPLQPRETDINQLIVESAKLMRPTLGEQIEIESALENAACAALVDPNQLSSALLNLAINARDAMPGGGKLTLETKNVVLDQTYAAANADVQPGSYVMIAVSDTGIGIPEAIRDRVFDPFFSTKGIGKGTGLGLSMVYGFVKQSGGHIKVYSEEGHGSTFRIYLPRAAMQPHQLAEPSPPLQVERGNETILIVEDDALVRTYVNTQLRSLGYETLSAANGTEALSLADSGAAFDLLFTDVIMPGRMNGRELAEEMAKRRAPLRVLFTSGYTENAIIHHGRLDPGVLLLAKPYRQPDLARMIRLALASEGINPGRSAG